MKEGGSMQLTEQHIIGRDDPRFAAIDAAAFKSKNLYNAALYEIRQAFIHHGTYLDYNEMDRCMQSHEAYQALPAKVSQQVLRQLDNNWTSFFEALEAYKEYASKFTGRPRLPKYKHKTEGRNVLIYTLQALAGGQTLHKDEGRIYYDEAGTYYDEASLSPLCCRLRSKPNKTRRRLIKCRLSPVTAIMWWK